MEFYFGDSNLAKDKFLAQKLGEDPDGYVNVDLFLTFNKIRALSNDTQDIIDALSSSEILEVASDGKRLRRKKPVERTDFDDCTIYVERLPPHADHKWLRDVFNRFGNVTHTSIPRFRMSGKIKGFAFIEFESPECVLKASKHFKTSTESGESDTGEESDDPKDKKTSGKAKKSQCHYKEHQTAKGKDGTPHKSNKKRKRNESEGSDRFGTHRKSLESEDPDGKSARLPSEINGKNEAADAARSASELESCDEKSEAKSAGAKDQSETVDTKSDSISPHKCGRKRKRRDTDNEGTSKKIRCDSTSTEGSEITRPQAHVSGSDNESKSAGKVKEFKSEIPNEDAVVSGSAEENDQVQQTANILPVKMEGGASDSERPLTKRQKQRRRKKKSKADDDKPHLRVLTKAEWKMYRNKYLSLQRASMVHVKRMLSLENQQPYEEDEDENYDQSPVKEDRQIHKGVEFQPGVIIKLKLSEPAENCQKLTKQLKSLADVNYVDATEGSPDVYIRCPSKEAVSAIIAEARFSEFGDTVVAEADEEASYWKKVIADRETKFGRKSKRRKRGRDKLISRAAKMLGMNTHVHFDDDDD